MSTELLQPDNVAIIGAGVSGVSAAVHLKRAGLRVTVFERSSRAGGVWAYNAQIANDAAYPSTLPSTGDSPEWEWLRSKQSHGRDSPMEDSNEVPDRDNKSYQQSAFAPPGPCYMSLKSNVSTLEMEMTCQAWKPETAEFVSHYVLADYIEEAARSNGALGCIEFNRRVDRVEKVDGIWEVDVSKLEKASGGSQIITDTLQYDAVVIASGHYHACNIPDIPGLSLLKKMFPDAVRHSKLYRSAHAFNGQTVLLIGGGVSSLDIAKDLGSVAHLVIQSTRDGAYDLPPHLLPENAVRIGPIDAFSLKNHKSSQSSLREAASVRFADGREICNIDQIIICTGYYVSFPYMRQYHADGVGSADADENVLVTDGQQTHNLHKDIWYIPDPTLAFIGVPYHVATFSAFEFQAMALAAVFSGEVPLPGRNAMQEEYNERLRRTGAGRTFHSLKGEGQEIAYVNQLAEMVTRYRSAPAAPMLGHTERWHEAYARRLQRRDKIFTAPENPSRRRSLEEAVFGC